MNPNASIVSGQPAKGILDAIPIHSFPNIWEKIFMNLSRLDDLRNVSRANKGWKEVLQSTHIRSTRMLQFFPKVFPFLSKYLGKNDILNLRKVCSAWSQGVDESLEEIGRPTPYKEGEGKRHKLNPTRLTTGSIENPIFRDVHPFPYVICNSRDRRRMNADAFLESMGDHPRNPFIGRQFHIFYFYQEPPMIPIAGVQDGVNKLFPRLGHHLTYISILIGAHLAVDVFTGLVQTVLNNSRNLKQFDLLVSPVLLQARTIAPEVNVPVLTQLQTLQLASLHGGESPAELSNLIQNLIRLHSAQLERLDVNGVNDATWTTLRWPNLRELRVALNASRDIALSSLLNMEAPHLSRLFIRYEGKFCYYGSDLEKLLKHFPSLKLSNIVITTLPAYY